MPVCTLLCILTMFHEIPLTRFPCCHLLSCSNYVIARTSLIEYTISQQSLNDKVIEWNSKVFFSIILPRLEILRKYIVVHLVIFCQLWTLKNANYICKKKEKEFLVSSDVNMYTYVDVCKISLSKIVYTYWIQLCVYYQSRWVSACEWSLNKSLSFLI